MLGTAKKIYEEIAAERPPCERRALLGDHDCGGRSTMEHAWKHAGRQIHRKWAIVRLCEKAHAVGPYQTKGGIMDKRVNEWISLGHATAEDLREFPRTDWDQKKKYLDDYIRTTYGKAFLRPVRDAGRR